MNVLSDFEKIKKQEDRIGEGATALFAARKSQQAALEAEVAHLSLLDVRGKMSLLWDEAAR